MVLMAKTGRLTLVVVSLGRYINSLMAGCCVYLLTLGHGASTQEKVGVSNLKQRQKIYKKEVEKWRFQLHFLES